MPNTIGIRREDLSKIGEQRCAVAPPQARRIVETGARLLVQPAVHPETGEQKRIFEDNEYVAVGAELQEDLSDARIIIGLKEVDPSNLLPGKAYVFFSHTHKGQQKNRGLLRAMMDSRTTLIDYELVENSDGVRQLTAFTYFAGYAGIVDTLWTFGRRLASDGIRSPFEDIHQSIHRPDLSAVRDILQDVGRRIERDGTPKELPPVVVCILGRGKTSAGAQELLDLLPVELVTIDTLPGIFKGGSRKRLYKLVLEVDEMYRISDRFAKEKERFEGMTPSERFDFYLGSPQFFESNLEAAVLPYSSVLVNCITWTAAYPRTITSDMMARVWQGGTPLKVIGDITCDPNGSIEFSRETWIDDPVFTYDPETRKHRMGLEGKGIAVMAVTNLPCEFSRDASTRFSQELERFLPSLLSVRLDGSLEESGLSDELTRATILWRGRLTPRFTYMGKYAA